MGQPETGRVAAPRGAAALRAVRAGRLAPSGKCEFYSEWLAKQGIDPLPFYNPPAKRGQASPFVSLPRLRATFSTPPSRTCGAFATSSASRAWRCTAPMPPSAASWTATWCAYSTSRGSYRLRARVNGRPRRGVRRSLGVVEEALARPAQREQPHLAAHERYRRRRDVLRLPGAGRQGVSQARRAAAAAMRSRAE